MPAGFAVIRSAHLRPRHGNQRPRFCRQPAIRTRPGGVSDHPVHPDQQPPEQLIWRRLWRRTASSPDAPSARAARSVRLAPRGAIVQGGRQMQSTDAAAVVQKSVHGDPGWARSRPLACLDFRPAVRTGLRPAQARCRGLPPSGRGQARFAPRPGAGARSQGPGSGWLSVVLPVPAPAAPGPGHGRGCSR
jgi:hypothetical protein